MCGKAKTMARGAIVALLLTVATCPCRGQWEWSRPAAHHKAAVTVRDGRGNLTSGTLIRWGKLRGVLTVAHGLKTPTVTVTFATGQRVKAPVTIDRTGADVGFVFADHPRLPHVEVSQSPPRRGGRVEYVTSGGPRSRLRHFYGRVGRLTPTMRYYRVAVVSGDSGGGILQGGKLVGVQSVGIGQSIRSDWPTFAESGASPHKATCLFLNRIINARRNAGGRFGAAGDNGGDFYPPVRIGGGLINIGSPKVVEFRQGSPGDDGDLGDFAPGIGRTQQMIYPACEECEQPADKPETPDGATIQPVPQPAAAGVFAILPITVQGSVDIKAAGQAIQQYKLVPK